MAVHRRGTVDSFGRKTDYLRISVTPHCNLRCAYCMPGGGLRIPAGRDVLTIKQMEKIAGIFASAGISKVRITGGEPLLRKGVAGLVKSLKKTDGIEQVTMTTNGVLLDRFIPELVDAGLDRINISLDTLRRDRMKEITGYAVLDKVTCVIRKIVDERIWPIKINVVPVHGVNGDEILDFAGLARDHAIEVRFIEMMPTAHNGLWKKSPAIHNGAIEDIIRERHRLVPAGRGAGEGPAVVYEIDGGPGRIGFVSPLSGRFCGDCNRLRLTADGKLVACLFSRREIDLTFGLRENREDAWFVEQLEYSLARKLKGHSINAQTPATAARPMASIGG